MTIIFNLPDLGEGLPDAEIHEWFVKEGDAVKADQPLVSMETAKAVVDIPSPQDGIIAKLHGKPGDILKTGSPLVSFISQVAAKVDKGTVVGNLEESDTVHDEQFAINNTRSSRIKAPPAIKLLAKKYHVDLTTIQGSGEHGIITRQDVEKAANKTTQSNREHLAGYEPLRGVRRNMLHSMVQSHQTVVPVSIFDEADIEHWPIGEDITVRLIQAIVKACRMEPSLNAWFNTEHSARKCFEEVHIGLAVDTEDGLFVPVIKNAHRHSAKDLRAMINEYKISVQNRSITPENLTGATITLSNFGKFAGRFASPIIIPPTVAILAVGRVYSTPVLAEGTVEMHKTLPLSLSFDHRAVTGGEATRFLGAIIESVST